LGSSISSFMMLLRRINARQHRIKYQLLEYKSIKFIISLGREISKDDISNMAASISYYAFLSLFPLLLGLLAVFSIFFPSESILQQLINLVSNYLPGSKGILENNIADLIQFRGAIGAVGVIGLLWSGSGVFSAITHAINRAWDIKFSCCS
jgi:membrane protein